MAADRGCAVREVPAPDIQAVMRKFGADPGDRPSANATVSTAATEGADI
ncbi:hypothetical protein HEP87_63860 [Streptomyces sp. S1D4-11]